ncbi:hypothetical protein ALI144C_17455 [Actinosynnema sp. ALI-1.44]|uniref:peptide deformylase n=1 Tax=Actinosynnema sp. ALI-1.44 TaxID=1933779 RepID=UPI00097C8148|nr:peptide deformylase [Actinosynnema sp. ALI-1.44]ONI82854.1 hypothetical protein ALI144C_17455 [Actinosynnema sp. ALI-1.44]
MADDLGSQPDEGESTGAFSRAFSDIRQRRGLSRNALAKLMNYSRSYVSKVESGAERPSRNFLSSAERAMNDNGTLRRAYAESFENRTDDLHLREAAEMVTDDGTIQVLREESALRYDNRVYRLNQRRLLLNNGTRPIDRYLIRIAVGKFPDDPKLCDLLYSQNPVTWDELDLRAWRGTERTKPMRWAVHHDKPDFKEVWLRFGGDNGHFPLYPGESGWIEYEYTVDEQHWGDWYQRTIRLPTRHLSIRLDFPAAFDMTAWGLYTSMWNDAMPFATPIQSFTENGRQIFLWATDNPPVGSRYRVEWKVVYSPHPVDEPGQSARPSQNMKALGIRQRDDDILRRRAREFELPLERNDAERTISELRSALNRVALAHVFAKGSSISAQQIGIDRAAAIVRSVEGEMIELLNPRIIRFSDQIDEQYEGCLSFFDVRGVVPRALHVEVVHTNLDGSHRITVFERAVARLVAHEVDHLNGLLYTDRMVEGAHLIPVEQYDGVGKKWEI